MDAAGEVQRLLQLVRARLRRNATLHQRQLSHQHFVRDGPISSIPPRKYELPRPFRVHSTKQLAPLLIKKVPRTARRDNSTCCCNGSDLLVLLIVSDRGLRRCDLNF